MDKIFYVVFEHIINNTMTFEYKEYPEGVMGATLFEGSADEFRKLRLHAEAKRRLVEKELI